MTENASNSFSRKNKKMLVFPKNTEKNASTIEKGLVSWVSGSLGLGVSGSLDLWVSGSLGLWVSGSLGSLAG